MVLILEFMVMFMVLSLSTMPDGATGCVVEGVVLAVNVPVHSTVL